MAEEWRNLYARLNDDGGDEALDAFEEKHKIRWYGEGYYIDNGEGEESEDGAAQFALENATPAELTDPLIGHEELLYRLFHQNDLHFFTPKNVDFGCRCSKEKVLEMLRHFSKQDRKDMIQNGVIKVDCQFCGKSYTLTLKDLGE